jgi:hypothetical protein
MAVNDIVMGAAGASGPATYIEDVFSTYLYTGNGSTQTITNGIDLSGQGGLTWIKSRSAATNNFLFDTSRGALNEINSNTTDAQASLAASLTAFNSTGFNLGAAAGINVNAATYASWTFRKQPKFFDIVTYTGNGANRTISHSLGSVPACIMVKRTDAVNSWVVYHKGTDATSPQNYALFLDLTNARAANSIYWNNTAPTSTDFTVGTSGGTNLSGATYVAYLFAHDAGGFGATGTDNVISCGTFTCDGSGNATVNLGYEPQYVLIKRTNGVSGWWMVDNMRGFVAAPATTTQYFAADAIIGETSWGSVMQPTATGFYGTALVASSVNIYIAIRRPMKTPTTGTEVFSPVTYTAAASTSYSTGLSYIDLMIEKRRDSAQDGFFYDRLRGNANRLRPASVSSEVTDTNSWSNQFANQGTVTTAATLGSEWQGSQVIWNMRRAAGFFDVVCYTGTSATHTEAHNLGVAPEMMIVKSRSITADWVVYNTTLGATKYLIVNTTAGSAGTGGEWASTAPTSSAFTVSNSNVNQNTYTYVAYLFATLAGVSKVGSYTGNGSSQTIACGFTAGARFILIKRTDSTGDWFCWDTARGIVAGNDGHLSLNTTAAEVTTDDSIDTDNSGFIVNQDAATNINVTSATYIFLAIA